MGDEEDGAGVVLERRFQELERLDVEVVGGLIEHEDVGGAREEPREEQAVALAAGEHRHSCVRAARREEEVAEVAHDVLLAARRLDPFRAGADGVGDGFLKIERGAELVEVGGLHVRAQAHAP